MLCRFRTQPGDSGLRRHRGVGGCVSGLRGHQFAWLPEYLCVVAGSVFLYKVASSNRTNLLVGGVVWETLTKTSNSWGSSAFHPRHDIRGVNVKTLVARSGSGKLALLERELLAAIKEFTRPQPTARSPRGPSRKTPRLPQLLPRLAKNIAGNFAANPREFRQDSAVHHHAAAIFA